MNLAFALGKLILIILYLSAALSPLLPSLQQYMLWLILIAVFLLVSHVAEFVAMKSKIVALQAEGSQQMIMTLLFGFLHWLPLLIEQQAKSQQAQD